MLHNKESNEHDIVHSSTKTHCDIINKARTHVSWLACRQTWPCFIIIVVNNKCHVS